MPSPTKTKKPAKWEALEKHVRQIASYKWEAKAEPRDVNGVRIDCVVEWKPDYWVVIEITQEESLDKLRTDLAKFASIRPFLFSKNIYADCYFICEKEPPASLPETGKGHNVRVLSLQAFDNLFFDFPRYQFARSNKKFGSAVDPTSGEKDTRPYVPVKYLGYDSNKEYTVAEIARLLQQRKHVVLLGNYGTGKSRCMQELFAELSRHSPERVFYPIAIDLRDNWGTRRAHELVQRHFDGLGLSEAAHSLIKIIETDAPCFLLDGFDEIGSQTWSDNPEKLMDIRSESLAGVRDLVSKTTAGVILTGRDHYFNSEEEMFQCLGLSATSTTVITCADEFSDAEMKGYLSAISSQLTLPDWLPRRPLMCQIIADMNKEDIDRLVKEESGETTFWQTMITALCKREARISPMLDADIIRKVLRRVSRLTRTKSADVGPISISEINATFEAVTGLPPVDESAIMLQRLPGLGRLASESTDRQFVDIYILDGLRAEDIIDLAESQDELPVNERWVNPLKRFGITLLSQDFGTTSNETGYVRYLRQAASRKNRVLAGDILSAMLCAASEPIDLGSLHLADTHISYLDLSAVPIKGLHLDNSHIDQLDISECQVTDVLIEECDIKHVFGVTAEKGLPSWMRRNSVENFEAVNTVARIRLANLSAAQRIFVTLIKKLFFQPGAGRQEEALIRGLGASADKKIVDRILKVFINDKIVERYKGRHGWVYTPNRRHARRMDQIITKLTLSDDPLWLSLEKLAA